MIAKAERLVREHDEQRPRPPLTSQPVSTSVLLLTVPRHHHTRHHRPDSSTPHTGQSVGLSALAIGADDDASDQGGNFKAKRARK